MTDGTPAPTREIGDDAAAEVAERARQELWTGLATVLPYVAGAALLFLPTGAWSSGLRVGLTAFLVSALGESVWRFGTVRGRRRQAGRLLSEYAVLRHADPGAGRRAPADEAARRFVRRRPISALWALMVLSLPFIAAFANRSSWVVPGALLLACAAAAQVAAREREARAGRRWLADPPGPPRD